MGEFRDFQLKEPPKGLFDRIILAIKRERELRHTRKILFGFLLLLIVSLIATPLSWALLISQAKDSGVIYFLSAAISDLKIFFALWQDFGLAILESLPIIGITCFIISVVVAVFTLRLFFHRKRLLLNYIFNL